MRSLSLLVSTPKNSGARYHRYTVSKKHVQYPADNTGAFTTTHAITGKERTERMNIRTYLHRTAGIVLIWCACIWGMCMWQLSLTAIDNAHFYRAGLWYGEPRTPKPWLFSFDAQLVSGSSDTSTSNRSALVPLFSRTGFEDLAAIGALEPHALRANIHCSKGFFKGQFDLFEAQFHTYLNICNGFFMHGHLPVRKIEVCNITFNNAWSHTSNTSPLCNTARASLYQKLKENGLAVAPFKESGVGDFSLLAGWSTTTYDSCHVDFVDASVEAGVLFPTSNKVNPNDLFAIPLGYNGHYAIPLQLDVATGFFDWFNIGFHSSALFFFNNDRSIRPKTIPSIEGIIRLAQPQVARVNRGTLWNLTLYLKGDHCAGGVSFLFGFSHDHQNRSTVQFAPDSGIDDTIANTDPRFDEWYMNVFHFLLEYDWANEDNPYGPRIGVEINHIINGKNIFNTSTYGGYIGIDAEWRY